MENKMYELLEKIYVELQGTKQELKDTKQELKKDIKNVEAKIDNLEKGQQKLKDLFNELETKNAERHFELSEKLNKLTNDVAFIKHKEFQTEQELFTIKDHLKIIK